MRDAKVRRFIDLLFYLSSGNAHAGYPFNFDETLYMILYVTFGSGADVQKLGNKAEVERFNLNANYLQGAMDIPDVGDEIHQRRIELVDNINNASIDNTIADVDYPMMTAKS
jgi:hypothetical protein